MKSELKVLLLVFSNWASSIHWFIHYPSQKNIVSGPRVEMFWSRSKMKHDTQILNTTHSQIDIHRGIVGSWRADGQWQQLVVTSKIIYNIMQYFYYSLNKVWAQGLPLFSRSSTWTSERPALSSFCFSHLSVSVCLSSSQKLSRHRTFAQ